MFNDVDLHADGHIEYEQDTGYVTLHPGIYRLDGWSLTSFGWQLSPAQQAETYSAPGYAFFGTKRTRRSKRLARYRIRCLR
jgi:hypothetical protein